VGTALNHIDTVGLIKSFRLFKLLKPPEICGAFLHLLIVVCYNMFMATRDIESKYFLSLIILSALILGYIFLPYLNAIILVIFFTVLFKPIHNYIKKALPKYKNLANALTVIISIIIILGPIAFFVFQILKEAQLLYTQFSRGNAGTLVDFVTVTINKYAPWLEIDFVQYAKQFFGLVVDNIGTLFTAIAGFGITLLLATIGFYYLLRDGQLIKRSIIKISPLSADNTEEIFNKLETMADSVIKGSIIVVIFQGIFVGLGFFMFGLENPVLWGAISIIAALIPFFGTMLIFIPAALSLALTGNFFMALGFASWCFIVGMFADNILRPRLIEKKSNVHPVLILLSVLGGLTLYGPTGFLIGPIALSLFLTLLDIYPSVLSKNNNQADL